MYSSLNLAQMVRSNDDRAIAINYAIKNGGLWGRGLGSIPMHYKDAYIKYMGLNSASSFIYMLGIVGYLIYSVFLSAISCDLIHTISIYKIFGLSVMWLVLSYLLPLYSSIIMMFGVGMIIITFAEKQKDTVLN